MKILGINIRKARERRGYTLRELASSVNSSPSLISQIETGKISPSLATLKKISDSLNTTIAVLVGEMPAGQKEDPVVKKSDRQNIKNMTKGLDFYLLTSPDPNKQMEPMYFTLRKGAGSGEVQYKHFGQEFILVIKGAMELTLNEQKYILEKGDSIYFNSSVPHSFRNTAKGETEAVWVVTPPTF